MLQQKICRYLILPTTVFMTACGGGSSTKEAATQAPAPVTPPATTVTTTQEFNGKVIDGYVSGAKVWLDINGNKQHDNSEPSAVSTDAGNYTLELNDEQKDCLAYATLYVDVPVGAIDEELGEVTEAYQMSKPPLLAPISDADLLHISPLTTVLWQQLENKVSASNQFVQSCQTLKENHTLRAELATEIDAVIRNLVGHYNISADAIYADFIATDNATAYQAAQSIVTGLKAAYSHKLSLDAEFTTADEIRVEVYQGEPADQDNAFPEAWYRHSIVFLPNGHSSKTVKLNDDLKTVERVIYDREESVSTWNNGTLSLQKDIYNYTGGEQYICSNSESATFIENGIEYQLSNSSPYTTAPSFAACNNQSFGNGSTKYYSVSYQESNIHYYANFTINSDLAEFDSLSHWQSLAEKATELDHSELIAHLKQLPYRFDDEVVIEVSEWHKRITDDSIATRVQTDKFSDGSWQRLTYQADYTYIKECSSDGINWQLCTG